MLFGIPADRESVFLHITEKHPEAQGLAAWVMDTSRKGKFARHGMPQEIESALRTMGMEQWFLDCCNGISYLFPKSHDTEFLRQELMLKWLERHG